MAAWLFLGMRCTTAGSSRSERDDHCGRDPAVREAIYSLVWARLLISRPLLTGGSLVATRIEQAPCRSAHRDAAETQEHGRMPCAGLRRVRLSTQRGASPSRFAFV